ncbi:acyl carrier protein [Nocardia sp. NPDC058058]|uniref:acyl carrier protein n=1 Tax=Nocardia sp. NPDC058058 TaxID=3346317 RepID=UPI0036DBA106
MSEQQAARTATETTDLDDRIITVIARVGGLERDEVTGDKTLVDDLDIDSLTLLEIAVTIQSEFGVPMPEEVLPDFRVVSDITRYVGEHHGDA